MKRELKIGMRGRVCGNSVNGDRIDGFSCMISSAVGEWVCVKTEGNYYAIHKRQFVPFKQKEKSVKVTKRQLAGIWNKYCLDNCFDSYFLPNNNPHFNQFCKELGLEEDV